MEPNAGSTRLDPPASRRRLRLPTRLSVPVAAGLALFAVNNFLLARLLTGLPGGTMLAATDMAAVALVARRVRRFGGVSLIYCTYGALGILGHLGVDAGTYMVHLPRLLAAALAFDAVVTAGRYRRSALALGLLLFVAALRLGPGINLRHMLATLALAYGGLAIGLLLDAALRPRPAAGPEVG